jgi:hypothetical protein
VSIDGSKVVTRSRSAFRLIGSGSGHRWVSTSARNRPGWRTPRPIAIQRAANKHTPSTTTAPETPPNCPFATPKLRSCCAAQPTNPAPHFSHPPAVVGKRMRLRLLLLARRLRRAPIPPSALPACSTPGSMSASCHPSPRTQGLLCPRI